MLLIYEHLRDTSFYMNTSTILFTLFHFPNSNSFLSLYSLFSIDVPLTLFYSTHSFAEHFPTQLPWGF